MFREHSKNELDRKGSYGNVYRKLKTKEQFYKDYIEKCCRDADVYSLQLFINKKYFELIPIKYISDVLSELTKCNREGRLSFTVNELSNIRDGLVARRNVVVDFLNKEIFLVSDLCNIILEYIAL